MSIIQASLAVTCMWELKQTYFPVSLSFHVFFYAAKYSSYIFRATRLLLQEYNVFYHSLTLTVTDCTPPLQITWNNVPVCKAVGVYFTLTCILGVKFYYEMKHTSPPMVCSGLLTLNL